MRVLRIIDKQYTSNTTEDVDLDAVGASGFIWQNHGSQGGQISFASRDKTDSSLGSLLAFTRYDIPPTDTGPLRSSCGTRLRITTTGTVQINGRLFLVDTPLAPAGVVALGKLSQNLAAAANADVLPEQFWGQLSSISTFFSCTRAATLRLVGSFNPIFSKPYQIRQISTATGGANLNLVQGPGAQFAVNVINDDGALANQVDVYVYGQLGAWT